MQSHCTVFGRCTQPSYSLTFAEAHGRLHRVSSPRGGMFCRCLPEMIPEQQLHCAPFTCNLLLILESLGSCEWQLHTMFYCCNAYSSSRGGTLDHIEEGIHNAGALYLFSRLADVRKTMYPATAVPRIARAVFLRQWMGSGCHPPDGDHTPCMSSSWSLVPGMNFRHQDTLTFLWNASLS